MKKNISSLIFLLLVTMMVTHAQAQWNDSGNNYTTGNLGLGLSNTSQKKIWVQSNASDHIGIFENISASGYGLIINSTNDPLRVGSQGNTSGNYLVVRSNGYVGIGTPTPSARLHVTNSDPREALRVYLNGNTTRYLNMWQGSGAGVIDPVGTGVLYLGYDQATNVLIGKEGGNLGIGDQTPLARLHASGSIYSGATRSNTIFSGTIAADNVNFIGSEGYWAFRTATNNSFNMDVYNGGSPKSALVVDQNGTVNIGASESSISGYGSRLSLLGASSNGDPLYLARYNNGTNFSELRVNIGDDYGQKEDMFVVGTHYWNDGNWYPHFAVQASGNVGIGTTDTHGFRLAVAGKTITEEVVVQLEENWPDYVFEPNYNLPSLSELEQYIKTNKHLPEVPSASEVKENGLSLGEMNAILLKKVEELTLHLIDQHKSYQLQQAEIDKLKEENRSLQTKLDNILKN